MAWTDGYASSTHVTARASSDRLPAIVGLALRSGRTSSSRQPTYLSARNLSNLVLQIGVTGTLAVGIVLVLLLSEIDLSVGSVSILCSAILASVVVNHGWSRGTGQSC